MDDLASFQQISTTIQLQYLIQLNSPLKQPQTISTLNQIYPFTKWPLTSLPPIEIFQCTSQSIISNNISLELQNYSYVVLKGQLIIRRLNFQYKQLRFLYIQDKIKIPFSITEGDAALSASGGTTYLKIHLIWIEKAKQQAQQQQKKYIRKKLLSIPFFGNLTFKEFDNFCNKGFIKTLAPGDLLLSQSSVPYHMYVVVEGQLIFTKIINFRKDKELWKQINHELQYQEETTSQLLHHLAKNPQPHQQTFILKFEVGTVTEGSIICGKQTLSEQKLNYSIYSSLKTKLICVRYPDLYLFQQKTLASIKSTPSKQIDVEKIRKQYYFGLKWKQYRQFLKKEVKLNKWKQFTYDDFLRNCQVSLNQPKHQYFPGQLGEGDIFFSPAQRLLKLKQLAFK